MPDLTLFRVLFDEERTRLDTVQNVMGWGVQFPSGLCYVDWNWKAYAPENRLERPHISQYGSLADVQQGTGGTVEVIHHRTVHRHTGTKRCSACGKRHDGDHDCPESPEERDDG